MSVALCLPHRAALGLASPAFLFGVRMWASVCLALLIAFELGLDDAYWAGMSAAVVCQPRLGASLRKGYFRMVGTVVGAVAAVILSMLFAQERLWFLLALAVWGGACGFASRMRGISRPMRRRWPVTRRPSSPPVNSGQREISNGAVVLLAITRAAEICIGIASAGMVLAGTDFGGARHRLATRWPGFPRRFPGIFLGSFALSGPGEAEARTTTAS